jgi:dTDP-4-dehydrorhamnose reductase
MADVVLVTGSRGQLGRALVDQLQAEGAALHAVDIDELDVADADAVSAYLHALDAPPRLVVNAAAFTQVDRCEREPEAARRGNALAPAVLADACRAVGAQLVHVSTDYVFAGDADRPYREDDATGPRSTYGRTKLEGERRVLEASSEFLVVRTSWVFGAGRNFLAAILAQAAQRRSGRADGPLRVVDDQRGRPTYAVDLAAGIRALLAAGARGLYHLANSGIATWWDVARLCLDESGYADLVVERIRTEDLVVAAPRPAWSVLDCSKAEALGVCLRSWQDAVRAYLASADSPRAAGTRAEA